MARDALNEAASALRSISRGHPISARLYCWFARYDLEAAASELIKLHNIIGDHGYTNQERQFALDTIYVFLGAHRRLSQERIKEVKEEVERTKRLNGAKF